MCADGLNLHCVIADHTLPLQESKTLLQCSCCGQLVHPACLVPPVIDLVTGDWSCHSCKEKTEEYLQARHAYIADLLKRFSISRGVHLWGFRGLVVVVVVIKLLHANSSNMCAITLVIGMKQLWSVRPKFWR